MTKAVTAKLKPDTLDQTVVSVTMSIVFFGYQSYGGCNSALKNLCKQGEPPEVNTGTKSLGGSCLTQFRLHWTCDFKIERKALS